MPKPKGEYKDRILKFDRIAHTLIVPHPKNPRIHLEQQRDVIRSMLEKYGIVDAIVVRKIGQNKYELINGHLRTEEITQPIPALIIDADDNTAAKMLATYDSISAAAAINQNALKKLISAQGEIDQAHKPIFDHLMGSLMSMEGYAQDIDLEKQFGMLPDKPEKKKAEADKKEKPAPADTNLINLYYEEGDHKRFIEFVKDYREEQGGDTIPVTTIILEVMRSQV